VLEDLFCVPLSLSFFRALLEYAVAEFLLAPSRLVLPLTSALKSSFATSTPAQPDTLCFKTLRREILSGSFSTGICLLHAIATHLGSHSSRHSGCLVTLSTGPGCRDISRVRRPEIVRGSFFAILAEGKGSRAAMLVEGIRSQSAFAAKSR
jgi:hypothetical protein